jgi:hypothetical protein
VEAPDADAAQTEAACCGRVSSVSAMPPLLLAHSPRPDDPPLQGGRSDPLSCDAWRLHRDSLASGAAPVGLVPRKDIASVTHSGAAAMPLLPDWTRPTIEHA